MGSGRGGAGKRSKTGATTRARVRLVRSVLARSFRAASATRAKPKISDATYRSCEIKTSWRLGKSTATARSPQMLSKDAWCAEPHPQHLPPPEFQGSGEAIPGGARSLSAPTSRSLRLWLSLGINPEYLQARTAGGRHGGGRAPHGRPDSCPSTATAPTATGSSREAPAGKEPEAKTVGRQLCRRLRRGGCLSGTPKIQKYLGI